MLVSMAQSLASKARMMRRVKRMMWKVMSLRAFAECRHAHGNGIEIIPR
jgi:hypothetical protein